MTEPAPTVPSAPAPQSRRPYWARVIPWVITAPLVFPFAAIHAAVDRGSTFGGHLMRSWVQFTLQTVIPRGDAETRRRQRLLTLFRLQRLLNAAIGAESAALYGGRPPKHHLWKEHNRYIYDAIRVGERVLDIGCGASEYQQWIAEKADRVVGADILPWKIERARKKNTMPNVQFEVMDVTKDLPEGEYDVAVCSHVLEHLDDPTSFLRSLAAKVPRIIVKVPLADSHWMKLVQRDIGDFWMDDPDHRREYSMEMLTEQLTAGGWRITEMIRGHDLRATAESTLTSNE